MKDGFVLYQRGKRSTAGEGQESGSKRNLVYYAKFYDESGNLTHRASTGCTNKARATQKAIAMMAAGTKAKSKNPVFVDYLLEFWSPESDYVQDRRFQGHPISDQYIHDNNALVRNHLRKHFKDLRIGDVVPEDLKSAVRKVFKETGSARVANRCIVAVKKAYATYCHDHAVHDSLAGAVGKFREPDSDRGVLFEEEAKIVFEEERWSDRRMWIANLLAATAALRQGEIRVLRPADIRRDQNGLYSIKVERAWRDRGGENTTKGKKVRIIPIPVELVAKLQEIQPASDTDYYFKSAKVEKPLVSSCFLDSLKAVMSECGIDHVARHICFHSWRHYAACFALDRLTLRQTMVFTGHSTEKAFRGYIEHTLDQDFTAIREVQNLLLPLHRPENQEGVERDL